MEAKRPNFGNDQGEGSYKTNFTRILLYMFLGLFVVTILTFSYKYFISDSGSALGEPKFIKADKSPYKIEPDDPGGINIPFMDNTIYDNISGTAVKKNERERLLPPPEEPISKKSLIKVKEPVIEVKEVKIINKNQETKKKEPEFGDMDSLIDNVIKEDSSSKSKVKVKLPDENAERNQGYRIQLASLKVEAEAEKEFTRLKSKHKSLIGDKKLFSVRKDMGEKGIVYALTVGIFKEEEQAKKTCKKLIEMGQNCYVVR